MRPIGPQQYRRRVRTNWPPRIAEELVRAASGILDLEIEGEEYPVTATLPYV
jgi:hypothetical protein